MPYLIAAVTLVGCLCVFDLVLSLGLIRRLREQTETLNKINAGHRSTENIPVGQRVGDFSGTATSGATVSRGDLTGVTLVGFFSPGCRPCDELRPRFVEYASKHSGDALAVVISDMEPTDEHAEALATVAQVVLEPSGGPVNSAFAISGYPTMYLVDSDGTVIASGSSMRSMPDLSHV